MAIKINMLLYLWVINNTWLWSQRPWEFCILKPNVCNTWHFWMFASVYMSSVVSSWKKIHWEFSEPSKTASTKIHSFKLKLFEGLFITPRVSEMEANSLKFSYEPIKPVVKGIFCVRFLSAFLINQPINLLNQSADLTMKFIRSLSQKISHVLITLLTVCWIWICFDYWIHRLQGILQL